MADFGGESSFEVSHNVALVSAENLRSRRIITSEGLSAGSYIVYLFSPKYCPLRCLSLGRGVLFTKRN